MTRDEIIAAYIKLARGSGTAAPPGMNQFLREYPEISQHTFRSGFWRSWRAFQGEAGFSPNEPNQRLPDAAVATALAVLTRRLGKVPTEDDIAFARRLDKTIPSVSAIRTRACSSEERIELLRTFCFDAEGWEDVAALLPTGLAGSSVAVVPGTSRGFVYLMKDGARYKIGFTNSIGRRESEAATWLKDPKVIHRIATDDPEGVERYWHRRFESKCLEREWFALTAADVVAFRRWKKII